jgi:HD-like signal output (HDOD) protein
VSPWNSLRRLFGPAPGPATAVLEPRAKATPPTPAAPAAPPPAAAPPVAAGPPPPVAGEAPATSIGLRLRAQFTEAVHQLDQELRQDQRTPELMTLIGHLVGDPAGRLRQPPMAAQRAMAACHNEATSSGALVALFENDPMLAQAVLARANSAYYNLTNHPCLSLAEAVSRQGRRSVHNVLLQQTLSGLIYWPGGGWNDMVSRVWSHMVRTGPLARAVAPLFDVDPEQAFALALLHDVGKLVVFDRIATLRTARRGDFPLPPAAITRMLRLLHESLGGLCALGWDFGDDAAAAIAAHHREPRPADPDALSEVIWLAEQVDLATQRNVPFDLPGLWPTAGLRADPDAVQTVLDAFHAVPASSWA